MKIRLLAVAAFAVCATGAQAQHPYPTKVVRMIVGYPPGGSKPDETTNHRKGTSEKRVLIDDGPMAVEIPRDREGTFEPQLRTPVGRLHSANSPKNSSHAASLWISP